MKLTVYPNNFTEPSDSPFCVKAMCLLEMADQQWTPHFSSDPRKAPKAKFPVLQDGDRLIADSDQIRDYLENTYQVDFDNGLGSEQRGISRAVIRMAEEHLYFALVCDRWVNDANWAQIKKAYFKDIPFLVNGFITRMIRKQVFGQLNGQGMGRHSLEERLVRTKKDVEAIQNLLDGKDFLFGDVPTAADATVVPLLRAIVVTPEPTELNAMVKQNSTLMQYLDRGKEAMYPKLAD